MTKEFKIYKANKMLDYIENQLTEWSLGLVTEHFGVETIEELTRDQLNEVIAEYYDLDEWNGTLGMGFRNIIHIWENEHEEYIL
jgi:hypothetical protein|tara:strand:+ start:383 stop:634 length:252 start_codon:yes stop_codon:yes gene_type:complete